MIPLPPECESGALPFELLPLDDFRNVPNNIQIHTTVKIKFSVSHLIGWQGVSDSQPISVHLKISRMVGVKQE